MSYLGADGTPISYNLYAYCGNNPITGYDPNGHWDWGGVFAGLLMGIATAIVVATAGVATPLGLLVVGAAFTTGAVLTSAAAADATMVADVSISFPVKEGGYLKIGVSAVVDFADDELNVYNHYGGGIGIGDGASYSVGYVDNYDEPQDYEKHFVDVNVGYNVGVDHCWNPLEKHNSSTKAIAISFSSGFGGGVGYDYYGSARRLLKW